MIPGGVFFCYTASVHLIREQLLQPYKKHF